MTGASGIGLWITLALMIGVPAIALPLPIAFLMQSFGPQRWAARRALLTTIILAALGYAALFAYFTIAGLPESVRSNPQLAQSAAGQAVMGGFIASGYGSLASFIYFYWHRNNPAQRSG